MCVYYHMCMKIKKKTILNLDFFTITALTVAATRIFLAVIWGTPFMAAQQTDAWHHSYTGLLIAVCAYFLPQRFRRFAAAIGVGLFIDEAYFLHQFIGITECAGYWSLQAYANILVWLILTFLFLYYEIAEKLTQHLQKKGV